MYEFKANYSRWVRLLVNLTLCLTLVIGIQFLLNDVPNSAAVMFGITGFNSAILWVILPRKYSIQQDRFKIHLGFSISISIPFENVDSVRKSNSFVTRGISFAGSLGSRVQIERRRGSSIVISPEDRELFLTTAHVALANWSDR
ncbi:MAG: PH domain-containing protein [Chloroflexota bacterium]|nr:PH domain-containing protein [Chloroflexota bacterium]